MMLKGILIQEVIWIGHDFWNCNPFYRADPRFAPSLCEILLQSNSVSHWLGANLESTLILWLISLWSTFFVLRFMEDEWTKVILLGLHRALYHRYSPSVTTGHLNLWPACPIYQDNKCQAGSSVQPSDKISGKAIHQGHLSDPIYVTIVFKWNEISYIKFYQSWENVIIFIDPAPDWIVKSNLIWLDDFVHANCVQDTWHGRLIKPFSWKIV